MPPDSHDGGHLVQSHSAENPVNVIFFYLCAMLTGYKSCAWKDTKKACGVLPAMALKKGKRLHMLRPFQVTK